MMKSIPFAIAAMLLTACGGGGGSSAGDNSDATVTGVEMPTSMSVVTAKTTGDGLSKPLPSAAGVLQKNATDTDTEYSTDPVNTYVYDASMESLGTVNMILCLMEQTRASDFINDGPYIALVDEDKCEQGQNQSSSGSTGQSSGGQTTDYSNWVVESTRANNSAPQIVKIWIPGDDNAQHPMDGQSILVEVTATEGVSNSKPFGSFSMNFKGVVDASAFGGPAGMEVETMRGSLSTVDNSQGKPQFTFANVSGGAIPGSSISDFSMNEAANVILDDADGNSGQALTYFSETFNGPGGSESREAAFAIAFDSNYLLRGKDDNGDNLPDETSCKSRTDFDTQVWRYNLYHAVDGTFNGRGVLGGERVALNSGFPFSYDGNNDGIRESYGFVGYHGVWTENGTLNDGASITRFDYATDSTTDYTANVSAGKLIRRTANSALLNSFQGDEFQFWGQHPTLNIHDQWLVTVNGSNQFEIIGTFSWGDNGPESSTTIDHDGDPGTAEVAVAATLSPGNGENIWLWSDALGGNVVYVHDSSVAAGSRTVKFYGEEFVSPADAQLFPSGISSVTLYCYDRCLMGGLTQNDVNAAGSDYDLYYSYAGAPRLYTLSTANGKLTLTDNSNGQEVSTVGLDLSGIGYDWGINTGDMLTSPLANPSEPWLVYDQAITLRWETGNNDWNRLVTVRDAQGNVLSFDRPVQFNYTHITANDANNDSSYDGKKLFLEYGGNGELWGFPWTEDSETHRWHAAVTLKDGIILTDGANNTYLVKAVEKEQTMKDDNAGCSSLNINSLFTDSSLELPDASDIGAVSITLNQKPVVTDAPKVIEGEIQE